MCVSAFVYREGTFMSEAQQTYSILVVANDPDLRMIVRLAMEEAGYEVQEAQVVPEFCAAHEQSHPLMIVDLSTSQEGEPGAILTAKREHPKMKIIAIGGGSRSVNSLFEDNLAGVARTFWKPFELGDFVEGGRARIKHHGKRITQCLKKSSSASCQCSDGSSPGPTSFNLETEETRSGTVSRSPWSAWHW